MFLLRVIVFFILVSLVLILGYPLIIVYDLANGGDGFGLCQDIMTCSIPISEGPRLLVFLIGAFFLLVFLLLSAIFNLNYYFRRNRLVYCINDCSYCSCFWNSIQCWFWHAIINFNSSYSWKFMWFF